MKLTVREGDRWYITIGNGAKVQDVTVVSFSKETVLVQSNDCIDLQKFGINMPGTIGPRTRYLFDKVTWVEKVRK